MIHVPKRLGVFMLGLGGLFGMRTPPEPEAIAQMSPARPPTGPAGPPEPEGDASTHLPPGVSLERPRRK